jgi:hypothetical protein
MSSQVLILGASDKPQRYSNKAMRKLLAHGHQVILVANRGDTIDGLPVYQLAQLLSKPPSIDTITVYVNAEVLGTMLADLLALKPRRVIFNPGTESTEAAATFRAAGVEVVNHCTLIMLDEKTF